MAAKSCSNDRFSFKARNGRRGKIAPPFAILPYILGMSKTQPRSQMPPISLCKSVLICGQYVASSATYHPHSILTSPPAILFLPFDWHAGTCAAMALLQQPLPAEHTFQCILQLGPGRKQGVSCFLASSWRIMKIFKCPM